MPRLSLRDRFFTPPVARAITSPSGILLAGAGLSIGIVTGLPLLVAAGLGAAAWGARVAAAIPREPRGERIDPFTLSEPWRQFVREALQAQSRFREAVSRAKDGPLRDRLAEIADRIDIGVEECWRIARQGQSLGDARKQIDVPDISRQLESVNQNANEAWAAGSPLARTAEALHSQLATARRMDHVISDTLARLQLLDARLDEAVTRSIELSVTADSTDQLGGLGADVDDVVSEMEALRQALDETSSSRGTGSTGGTALPGTA